jgi:hypothetical protein
MFEFLNLALIGGLASVVAPVLIHLSHRRKVKQQPWGAMRFLEEMLARSRRRLLLDEWLLLAVRVMALLLVALALVRPAVKRAAISPGAGLGRQGRTASVVMIDDSLSTSAGRSRAVFEEMKALTLAYLTTLSPGDEVSLLTRSEVVAGAAADPLYDLEAVRTRVSTLQPTSIASDMPGLIEAGLAQLARHINPGAELVLVCDGRQDGWRTEERLRWEEIRARLRGTRDAVPGSRQRPHLILLSPPAEAMDSNLAVSEMRVDRTLVTAGQSVGLRVRVSHQGGLEPHGVRVRLMLNGQPAGERLASLRAGGQEDLVFPMVFSEPGGHAVEAILEGVRDSLAADDRRALAVQVELPLPVLLVEGQSGAGFESSLAFVEAALDPGGQGKGPFRVTRLAASQVSAQKLGGHRVVVLGDVAGLDAASVGALERFIVSGGGLLAGFGLRSDRETVNRTWARGGSGFLPCPLGNLAQASPGLELATAAPSHPVFNAFAAQGSGVWQEVKVRRWFHLDLESVRSQEIETLLRLSDGSPLAVARRRGLGEVILFATSLNGQWTDLPIHAAFVPLVRGMVGHLGSFVMPPRNLRVGERITFARSVASGPDLQAEGPGGVALPLRAGVWEGRQAQVSEPVLVPGVYSIRESAQAAPVRFAVAIDPEESLLQVQSARERVAPWGETPVNTFRQAAEVVRALDPANRRSVELWRWLVAAGVGLLFVESWLARRERQLEAPAPQTLPPPVSRRSPP